MENWDPIIRKIYEVNPDVTLVVVGTYNPMKTTKLTDASVITIGKAFDTVCRQINTYMQFGSRYAGKYLYAVPGGEIHRYNGATLWAAGKAYEGAFMMDRNLGARASGSVYMPDTYGYLYQYGRKDPFTWDSKGTGAVNWTTPNPDGAHRKSTRRTCASRRKWAR